MADTPEEIPPQVPSHLRSDRPIERADEDALERGDLARLIADEILGAPRDGGFVIALQARWGVGKTSLINLVVERLGDRVPAPYVIRFNPWLFSGSDQLLRALLREISSVLAAGGAEDSPAGKVATWFDRYAEVLSPMAKLPKVGWLFGMGSEWAQRRRGKTPEADAMSLASIKKRLDDLLGALDGPLVVVIDDVDRLMPDEVAEVLRLVRAVADFPNSVYLMAFDRARIEQSIEVNAGILSDEGYGRGFIEKIVQLSHDLPAIQQPVLDDLVGRLLDEALEGVVTGPYDQNEGTTVYANIVRPLVRMPRDAKRYVTAVGMTARILGDEICLQDIMALEAIRVFMPNVFAALPSAAAALTTVQASFGTQGEDAGLKTEIESLQELGSEQPDVVRNLCRFTFPASERHFSNMVYGADWLPRWQRNRRVAHPDILKYYLEQRLPEGAIPASAVERAFNALASPEALSLMLAGYDSRELESLIARLAAFEGEFTAEMAESAIPVLMNAIPRLRVERRGVFDFGSSLVVTRVVLRLLRGVEPLDERERIVEGCVPRICSLWGKTDVIDMAGSRENIGHGLVSEEFAHELESSLLIELLGTPPEVLAGEAKLGELLGWVVRVGGEDAAKDWLRAGLGDAQFVRAFFASVLTEHYVQELTRPSVARSSDRLPWDWLVGLAGDEALAASVQVATEYAEPLGEREARALELAERYASGWCPDRHED